LTICEKVLGPEHPHTARSLDNLAELHQGDITAARPLEVLGPSIRHRVEPQQLRHRAPRTGRRIGGNIVEGVVTFGLGLTVSAGGRSTAVSSDGRA